MEAAQAQAQAQQAPARSGAIPSVDALTEVASLRASLAAAEADRAALRAALERQTTEAERYTTGGTSPGNVSREPSTARAPIKHLRPSDASHPDTNGYGPLGDDADGSEPESVQRALAWARHLQRWGALEEAETVLLRTLEVRRLRLAGKPTGGEAEVWAALGDVRAQGGKAAEAAEAYNTAAVSFALVQVFEPAEACGRARDEQLAAARAATSGSRDGGLRLENPPEPAT